MADTRAELGRLIRRAVEREGATPTAIGRICGLSRPYVYTILKGGTDA